MLRCTLPGSHLWGSPSLLFWLLLMPGIGYQPLQDWFSSSEPPSPRSLSAPMQRLINERVQEPGHLAQLDTTQKSHSDRRDPMRLAKAVMVLHHFWTSPSIQLCFQLRTALVLWFQNMLSFKVSRCKEFTYIHTPNNILQNVNFGKHWLEMTVSLVLYSLSLSFWALLDKKPGAFNG
jgi:hypothetical protein